MREVKMSWDDVSDTECPIARACSVVGDRWTLLILRELIMGTRRFDDLQAQTGMSSHLLSTRLKRLEKDGVVERRLYSERPPRYEYRRTEQGKELDPVILLLRQWGMKYGGFGAKDEPAAHMIHKKTGKVIDADWRMPSTGKKFTFDDTRSTISKRWTKEREARRTAFRAAKGLSE
jgi:DNA-binding HxlR family transcriptional regulator